MREARRMGIPVVAIVDTNCDPNLVDWVIPGNDDALRAIRLFTSKISDAVLAGRQSFEQSQIADQKASRARAAKKASDYVDTSAYESTRSRKATSSKARPCAVCAEEAAAPVPERRRSSGNIKRAPSVTRRVRPGRDPLTIQRNSELSHI